MSSGVYYCKHCKFDVCSKCPEVLNVAKYNKCPKCSNQLHHVHCITESMTGKYCCFVCDKEYLDMNGVYMCEFCQFLRCPNCEKEEKKKKLFKELKASSASQHATPEKQLFKEKSPLKLERIKKASPFAERENIKELNLDVIKNDSMERPVPLMTFGDRKIEPKNEKNMLEVIAELDKIEYLDVKQKKIEEISSISQSNSTDKPFLGSVVENKRHYHASPQPKGDSALKSESEMNSNNNIVYEKQHTLVKDPPKIIITTQNRMYTDHEYEKMFRKI